MKKNLYIEILRVIAIFFVIFNHTGNNGYFLFSLYPIASLQFWIYIFISIFCRLSVPLFFMLSGILLLERNDECLKTIFVKRISRIIIALTIVSLFYYLDEIIHENKNFDVINFFQRLYSSELKYHLWYLYLYIAFLASLPFLRVLKTMSKNSFVYLFVLALFFNGVLPCLEFILSEGTITLNGNAKVSWATNAVVIYPLTGYFFKNHIANTLTKRKLLCLWIINVFFIWITAVLTIKKGLIDGGIVEWNSQTFYNCFVWVNSLTVLATVYFVVNDIHISDKVSGCILSLGRGTFGIYLVHAWVLDRFYSYFLLATLHSLRVNYMFSAFLMCIWILVISYIITSLLIRIPILKRII